jgi:hypothetical protein
MPLGKSRALQLAGKVKRELRVLLARWNNFYTSLASITPGDVTAHFGVRGAHVEQELVMIDPKV